MDERDSPRHLASKEKEGRLIHTAMCLNVHAHHSQESGDLSKFSP